MIVHFISSSQLKTLSEFGSSPCPPTEASLKAPFFPWNVLSLPFHLQRRSEHADCPQGPADPGKSERGTGSLRRRVEAEVLPHDVNGQTPISRSIRTDRTGNIVPKKVAEHSIHRTRMPRSIGPSLERAGTILPPSPSISRLRCAIQATAALDRPMKAKK